MRLLGEVDEEEMDNGLSVLMCRQHNVPIVALFIWYGVGSRNEKPGKTGMSHWVEHMIFNGTDKYPKEKLIGEITKNGGDWNGFTWKDFTGFYEVLPADKLELAVDIEADRMVNCSFSEPEVERERTVILSEREGAEDSPLFHLGEAVSETAFRLHPYRLPTIGYRWDVKNMTRDDLYDHYRTHYTPRNAVAVLVGDFEKGRALDLMEEKFDPLSAGPDITEKIPQEPPQQGEKRVEVRRPGANRYLQLAFHVPPINDARYYPLAVLDAVLGGGKLVTGWSGTGGMGRSSRLYRSLVAEGLCSSAGTSLEPTKDPGLFTIRAIPEEETGLDKVEEVVRKEIDAVKKRGIDKEEMQSAKKQLKAHLAYGMEGIRSKAQSLGLFAMVDDWRHLKKVPRRVDGVKRKEVVDVARGYLDEENLTVGRFIPTDGRGETR